MNYLVIKIEIESGLHVLKNKLNVNNYELNECLCLTKYMSY